MLAVTLRQLQRGRSMSLAECFRMEDLTEDAVEAFFKQRWPRAAHPLANLERDSL
jgi:hypothetical protein